MNKTKSDQPFTETDPFKTRDEEFMKYKYRLKHSRNLHPYLTNNSLEEADVNRERHEEGPSKFPTNKSADNFQSRNLIEREHSRDRRLQEFAKRNKIEKSKTVSNIVKYPSAHGTNRKDGVGI